MMKMLLIKQKIREDVLAEMAERDAQAPGPTSAGVLASCQTGHPDDAHDQGGLDATAEQLTGEQDPRCSRVRLGKSQQNEADSDRWDPWDRPNIPMKPRSQSANPRARHSLGTRQDRRTGRGQSHLEVPPTMSGRRAPSFDRVQPRRSNGLHQRGPRRQRLALSGRLDARAQAFAPLELLAQCKLE